MADTKKVIETNKPSLNETEVFHPGLSRTVDGAIAKDAADRKAGNAVEYSIPVGTLADELSHCPHGNVIMGLMVQGLRVKFAGPTRDAYAEGELSAEGISEKALNFAIPKVNIQGAIDAASVVDQIKKLQAKLELSKTREANAIEAEKQREAIVKAEKKSS